MLEGIAGPFAVAVLFLLASASRSEATSPREDLLRALVAEARSENPDYRSYETAIQAAEGQFVQVKMVPKPQVVAFVGPYLSGGGAGQTVLGYQQEFELLQPFYFPGKVSLRKAVARRDVILAQLLLQEFGLSLEVAVRSLAQQVAVTVAGAAAAREIEERTASVVDFLEKRPKAGILGYLDARILAGSLIGLQQELRWLEESRWTLIAQLNAYLGRPADMPVPEQLLPWEAFPPVALDRLLAQAQRHNILLQIHRVLIDRARQQRKATQIAGYPDFALGPFWMAYQGVNYDAGPGVEILVGLPVGKAEVPGIEGVAWANQRGNLATAKAQEEQAMALFPVVQRNLESLVFARLSAYEATRNQLALQPPSLITSLKEAAALAERQYRIGAIDVHRFLAAQQQYLSAFRTTLNARMDAATAWLDLFFLTGGEFTTKGFPE
ncbi:MAG: TolC family protein [Methylacidiphilaceae bacterium]|nr:TolC family protein [Candidatus Methylacidiphilaceae bacterium]